MTTISHRGRTYKVEAKVAPWRAIDHPRDSKGRFIETGAEVRILGGATGRVIRSVGGGRIEVERDSDSKRIVVHRNNLTVVKRPDGSEPTASRDDAPAPLPPEAPSEDAEVDDLADDLNPEAVVDLNDEPEVVEASAIPADAMAVDIDINAMLVGGGADDDPDEVDGEHTVERQRNEYDVFAYNLDRAIASIETANRRAERSGIPDRITYTTERYEVSIPPEFPGQPTRVEERVKITLDRPTVQHDGWTFVATLAWDDEAGLVTRVVPDATLRERPEARRCDVCKSARDRRDTYVVQNEQQEIQVGRNCLQQFMGIRPAGLWMLGWEPDADESREPREVDNTRRAEARYDSTEMLALGLAVVRDAGWVSRAASGPGRPATADRVADVMFGLGGNADVQAYRTRMRTEATALQDDARTILDTARTLDGDSEYETNLRAAATPDTVTGRNMGLLLSAISVHQRRQEQVARRRTEEEAGATSEHIGAVGDKIKDVEATVLAVRYIDGNYGVTTLLTFADADGNVIKWFASGRKDDLTIGEKVTLSGTIKGHGDFRGVKETTVTRAKYKRDPANVAADEERRRARIQAERDAEEEANPDLRVLRSPVPDDRYTALDPSDPVPLGTYVRYAANDRPMDDFDRPMVYRDGYVIGVGEDDDGKPTYLVTQGREASPYGGVAATQWPREHIVAIAPDGDPDQAQGLIDARARSNPMPDGFTRYGSMQGTAESRDALMESLIGGTVRIYNPDGGGYLTVTVIAKSGDMLTVRMPDGSTRELRTNSVTSYIAP